MYKQENIVTLKLFAQKGPNGDRATSMTNYYSYEIAVNDFVVKEFSGYDSFYCHVEDQQKTKFAALNFAESFADALGVARPDMLGMKKITNTTTEWVEDGIVRASTEKVEDHG